jgi:hypothetical protein
VGKFGCVYISVSGYLNDSYNRKFHPSKMKQNVFFLFLVLTQTTFGQTLPVIKANSKIVDVVEDGILNKEL